MQLPRPAIVPALLTPYDEAGSVDHDALAALVAWLLDAGVDGLMPCGTTGETALLTDDEVVAAVRTVSRAAGGRVPVLAHVGRPSTAATIALAERALEAGAAAVSAVVPYYHPLDQEAIADHYRALMAAIGPDRVLAYNIPSHTINDLRAGTLARLAREGLAGFKDTTLSAERHAEYQRALASTGRDDFVLLVGIGALVLGALRGGSAGAVLGIANLRPELCVALRDAVRDGDEAEAERLQAQLARAEEAAPAVADVKRAVAARLRNERGIAFGAAQRAPLGPAVRAPGEGAQPREGETASARPTG